MLEKRYTIVLDPAHRRLLRLLAHFLCVDNAPDMVAASIRAVAEGLIARDVADGHDPSRDLRVQSLWRALDEAARAAFDLTGHGALGEPDIYLVGTAKTGGWELLRWAPEAEAHIPVPSALPPLLTIAAPDAPAQTGQDPPEPSE